MRDYFPEEGISFKNKTSIRRLDMGTVLITSEQSNAEKDLFSYENQGGYRAWRKVLMEKTALDIIDEIEDSGLTGKGGAGFPVSKKWRLLNSQKDDMRYVIINGSEHEPGSIKDKYLLDNYPHKVLEGALITAYAVHASEVIVAINEESIQSVASFQNALVEITSAGYLDKSDIKVTVQTVPDKYIVGEESALLEVLEGREPYPRKKPPFPIEQGLFHHPTLIQNVETVAHIPFIINYGPEAYRNIGINKRGVTLCTIGEEFNYPGVYEVPLGTSIRTILYELGGGLKKGKEIKAIQPGGPSSGFLTQSQFDLPLDADILREHQTALGCAAIKAFSVDDCMVEEIGKITDFFASGSCGQCPECRMETNMFNTFIKQVCQGQGSWKLLGKIDDILEMVQGKGICGLIKMPVAPVKTGLDLFHDEFSRHIDGKNCPVCFGEKAIKDERL
jgi:NADH:ubiquinone oxidoreductase subunit F (NADH-binding)